MSNLNVTQRTKMDLVQTGDKVDTEKDFCLERFMDFAKRVCDKLAAKGHWVDYIDPCSGLSMVNKLSQQIYGEVDALVTLLNYQTTNSGCCKVVLHPTWGSAVYPASLFTKVGPRVRRVRRQRTCAGLDAAIVLYRRSFQADACDAQSPSFLPRLDDFAVDNATSALCLVPYATAPQADLVAVISEVETEIKSAEGGA